MFPHVSEEADEILYLLFQLLPWLQHGISSDQPQLLQLLVLHTVGQKKVEGERYILCIPGPCHINVVFGVHPLGVNLGEGNGLDWNMSGVETEEDITTRIYNIDLKGLKQEIVLSLKSWPDGDVYIIFQ